MDTIYVTLIGNMVIANKTASEHANEVMSCVHGQIADMTNGVNQCGDVRYSIKIRTVVTDLGK